MRMYEIMHNINQGKGKASDMNLLERLGRVMSTACLCGLGQAAPVPILTTMKHFRADYAARVKSKEGVSMMATVTIDGIRVSVPDGSTILAAAQEAGIRIPTLCHHLTRSIKANCRICVCEWKGKDCWLQHVPCRFGMEWLSRPEVPKL